MKSPLPQQAQRAIREYIVTHRLGPGDPLPSEGEFAQRLEMGKTSVREGISALESMGVVEVRHGRGIFVGAFSFDPLLEHLPYGLMVDNIRLREVLQVRQALEAGLIEEAARRLTADDLVQLDRLVERMRTEAVGDVIPFEIDRTFHLNLFAPLEDSLVDNLIDIFWTVYQNASHSVGRHAVLHTAEDHANILAAIRSDDPEAMRQAVVLHFADIRNALTSESTNAPAAQD